MMSCIETPAPVHNAEMAVWRALGGGNSGIVGNGLHVYGFHRGACAVNANDYSRRRDPNGADGPYPGWGWACAGDYHHGGNRVLRARHLVLLTRLMDGDPDLGNVCEFIGQPWPDKPVMYWARWDGQRTLVRYTGVGHDTWSHVSVYRSRANTGAIGLWTPASANVVRTESASIAPRSRPAALRAPAWPRGVAYFRASDHAKYSATVRTWQARMRQRGWAITVDGYYGPRSAAIATQFQREKHLGADGLLGPKTFAAAWTAARTG